MKKVGLFFMFFLILMQVVAQEKPQFTNCKNYKDSINFLTVYCDQSLNNEEYDKLITKAKWSLQYIKNGDYKHQSLFHFFIGAGFFNQHDSALHYFYLSKKEADIIKDELRIINAEAQILSVYNLSARFVNQQDSLAKILINKLDTTQNDSYKNILINPVASYYHQKGQYENEIKLLLQGVALLKKRVVSPERNDADSTNIGVGLYNIGDIYFQMQNEKAKEYYLHSRPYFNNFKLGLAYYHKGMIETYLLEQNLASAMLHLDSLQVMINDGFEDANSVKATAALAFSKYFLKQNKLNKAKEFLEQAKTANHKFPELTVSTNIEYIEGEILLEKGAFQESIIHFLAAEKNIESIGVEDQMQLQLALAKAYSGIGEWKKANDYFQKYIPLRDSIYTIAAKQSIANAEAKFQNKEKQLQIDFQKNEIAFAQKQRIGLVSSLVLIGLIAILLFVNFRNKKKTADVLKVQNEELNRLNTELNEANKTKAKLFGILSHDLRSPISQVYQFLKLQQLNPDALSESQKNDLNNKIQNATGSLLETMEDLLLWSKTQMNAFDAKLQNTNIYELIEESKKLLQLNSDAKKLHFHIDIPDSLYILTDSNFLQTIIRNLLQNAIKASPDNSLINIKSEQINNETILSIQNNGGVFTQNDYEKTINDNASSQSLNGLGLKLVDELSRKIKIKIQFESGANSTIAQIIFKN